MFDQLRRGSAGDGFAARKTAATAAARNVAYLVREQVLLHVPFSGEAALADVALERTIFRVRSETGAAGKRRIGICVQRGRSVYL